MPAHFWLFRKIPDKAHWVISDTMSEYDRRLVLANTKNNIASDPKCVEILQLISYHLQWQKLPKSS